jgi:transaldolase
MKIYLDTANLAEIREAARWGILSGVTTNPSLMAREEGADFEDTIRTIAGLVDGPISAETVSEDADGMVREGVEYAAWHSNVIIKVPATPAGLEAVSRLGHRGIQCNVTLIFNTNQALMAALAGAFVVSPFIGRLDDISQDGMSLIGDIVTIFDNYDFSTEVLVASIRSPMHLVEAGRVGADICTLPYKVFIQLMKHPLTDIGIERFLKDWESMATPIEK